MPSRLHAQLDQLEALEVEEERTRLHQHFEALHGHAPREEWLDQTLAARPIQQKQGLASAITDSPKTVPAPKSDPWSRWGSPSVRFAARLMVGSFMVGMGGTWAVAGALGHPGLLPDALINQNSAFLHEGMLLTLCGALLTPWKGIRHKFQRRNEGAARKWGVLSLLPWVVLPLFTGLMQAEIIGVKRVTRQFAQVFDTYKIQKEGLDQIFQVDPRTGASALPGMLAHDGAVCQAFRTHLNDAEVVPAPEIGQVLTGAQASIGYVKGCLTDQELFDRTNTYRARAIAWTAPVFAPGMRSSHRYVAQHAGMDKQKWCSITREWPSGTLAATREKACDQVDSYEPLDHPVSLAAMGVTIKDMLE